MHTKLLKLRTLQAKWHSSVLFGARGGALRDTSGKIICIAPRKYVANIILTEPPCRASQHPVKQQGRLWNKSRFYSYKRKKKKKREEGRPALHKSPSLRSERRRSPWNTRTLILGKRMKGRRRWYRREEKTGKGQGKLDRRFKMFITIAARHQLLSVRQRTAAQIRAWLPLTKPPYLTCPPVPLTRPSSRRRPPWLHL